LSTCQARPGQAARACVVQCLSWRAILGATATTQAAGQAHACSWHTETKSACLRQPGCSTNVSY
jgi:hypothetical protein